MGSFTTLMLGQQLKLLKGGREEARPHGNRLYIQVALSINETWVGGGGLSEPIPAEAKPRQDLQGIRGRVGAESESKGLGVATMGRRSRNTY